MLVPVNIGGQMIKNNSLLDVYMRHIAHANHIILKEVLDNIQNKNKNEND